MTKKTKIALLVLVVIAAAIGIYIWHKANSKKPAPLPVQMPDATRPATHVTVSDPVNGLNPDLTVNTVKEFGREMA